MITGIDHVMICVPDLDAGIAQFTKLGFDMHFGGSHPGKGTHNAIAFNREDYIELLAVRDQAEHRAAAHVRGNAETALNQFIAAGGGIRYIFLQSDDLEADVGAMRARGVDVKDPVPGGRRTPGGLELRWKVATLGPRNALPIGFVQHLTPIDERRKQVPAAGKHPNGAYALDRAYIVTNDLDAGARLYAQVLGIQPDLSRGVVIMADIAAFKFGSNSLGVVQPYAAGAAADALQHRGPGPFQALYRTTSVAAAKRWTEEHGLPPLLHGVRNTGEHALLATPEIACGAYVGVVGPE
jgi:catechol 2,3-dioxygenase-like lactoylglutathione lyase family enzyme